jgi:hypothetical protein
VHVRGTFLELMDARAPVRGLVRKLIGRLGLGSYEFRRRLGVLDRPHYAHVVHQAAALAHRLGYPAVSVLEYGVAGGNGLLSLEAHAREVERLFPVEIQIYGFDRGTGLPPALDHRDVPYAWKEGYYRMDEAALRGRLSRAKLVLGDLSETARTFFGEHRPAPVGGIVYDLDYHSSTAQALTMLLAGAEHFLPRVCCYFDDVMGDEHTLFCEFTGERLAIEEFNALGAPVKLGLPFYLRGLPRPEYWHQQLWIAHFFEHSRYAQFVGDEAALPRYALPGARA